MNSLDRQMIHYFRDELEKNALIAPMAKGVWKMVSGAGKSAYKGTKGLNQFFLNRVSKGDPTFLNKAHAGLLTVGTIGAGIYGTKKGFDTYKENKQQLSQLGPVQRAGIQQL